MQHNFTPSQELSLDPQDWAAMKQLAHQMVDDMFHHVQHISEDKVWKPIPDASKQFLKQALPQEPQPAADIYQDLKTHILAHSNTSAHPRFWSWVQGTGMPLAALADMWAATMNANVTIGEHPAMYVEQQVLDWCKEMLGFPSEASGILLSGASLANITALVVARNAFNEKIRHLGLHEFPNQMVAYSSNETHSCLQKAAEVCGLGNENMRKVPTDAKYKMDTQQLEAMIVADLERGLAPFCVVANAGTVNTGAIDDLQAIHDICRKYQLWFHIDGAFGALAKLLPEYASDLKALEVADSVAFDLHKWMYLPYEAGCLLVKNKTLHRTTFALQPNYLLSHERGLAAGPDPITNYGMELSRGFKALKIWMCFKEHGIQKFAALIRQNIAQASYLGELVQANPTLELLAPVTLNIVCFRYKPHGNFSEASLNEMNKELLMQLQEEGIAAPSYTFLEGKYAIRVAITNHRSRRSDFEAMMKGVEVLSQKIKVRFEATA